MEAVREVNVEKTGVGGVRKGGRGEAKEQSKEKKDKSRKARNASYIKDYCHLLHSNQPRFPPSRLRWSAQDAQVLYLTLVSGVISA